MIEVRNGKLEITHDVEQQTVHLELSHPDVPASATFVMDRDTAFECLELLRRSCAALLEGDRHKAVPS